MRIVIVDDHAVFREGLKSVLALFADFEVVGEAASARAAFPILDVKRPDLVILDLMLPGMDGASATRELQRRLPESHIVVLTICDAADDVLEVMAAGAQGYVLKSEPIDAVVEALRRVGKGQRYVTPRLAHISERAQRRGAVKVLDILSEREREVFRLATEGLTNAEIAQELCISRKTVETHKYRIQKKFGLRNSHDLLRFAALHGLIRLSRPGLGSQPEEGVAGPGDQGDQGDLVALAAGAEGAGLPVASASQETFDPPYDGYDGRLGEPPSEH